MNFVRHSIPRFKNAKFRIYNCFSSINHTFERTGSDDLRRLKTLRYEISFTIR